MLKIVTYKISCSVWVIIFWWESIKNALFIRKIELLEILIKDIIYNYK